MKIEAFAKLNLSLLVRSVGSDGFHPIRSRMQSVEWGDRLEWFGVDADQFTVVGDAPDDESNLAWRAMEAVRRHSSTGPVGLSLTKAIPPGAGLGGGSADAAAVLGWAVDRGLIDLSTAEDVAMTLGSDIAFCLRGGSAIAEGRGELLTPLPTATDHAYGVVVPEVHLSTPTVYRQWDRLDEPTGPELDRRHLPPSLRDEEPFRNDLWPAALSLAPELGDLASDLSNRWDRPVLMTGSGSALFGLFADIDEASSAIGEESGWRAAAAASPADSGRRVLD